MTASRYTPDMLGLDMEKTDADIAQFRGLPLHAYFDPTIFAFEQEAIFDKSWQFLCPAQCVAKPGDLFKGQIGRSSIVVTRDKKGGLNAFLNICRHRGFKLVEENASGKPTLRCRYHGWTYDLQGNLIGAPDTRDEPGFDLCDHGLIQVSVAEWGPLVFVNPDPNAAPFLDCFPQLEAWADEIGINRSASDYEPYKQFTIHQQSNWKLWYDNGTECYHCPTIHSGSFADAFDVREGSYDYRLEGGVTSYAFKSTEQLVGDELRSLTYASYQTFPGLQFIQQDDLTIIGVMVPTGPETCTYTTYYLKEVGADEARVDQWIDVWQQTFEEDGAVAEIQQANIKAPGAQPFRYVSNREEPTIFINRLIWDAYKRALCPDQTPTLTTMDAAE